MKFIKIYEDHNVDLFPFFLWADSWGRLSKPVLGANLDHVMLVFEHSSVQYYLEEAEFASLKRGLVERFLDGFLDKVVQENESDYSRMRSWCFAMASADLAAFASSELASRLRFFCALLGRINAWGMSYSLAEYGPASEFTQGLEGYLASQALLTGARTPPSEAFSILTSAVRGTQLRRMLVAINAVALKAAGSLEARGLFLQPADMVAGKLPLLFPSLDAGVAKLVSDFGWIHYGYTGPLMGKEYFIEEIARALAGDPASRAMEFARMDERTVNRQNELLDEFSVDQEHARRFRLCSELLYAKNYRKEMAYFALSHADRLLAEIARRLQLTPLQVRYFLVDELCSALENGTPLAGAEAEQRHAFCLYLIENGSARLLKRPDAVHWLSLIEEEQITSSDSVKGSCACPGDATGRVILLADARELGRVQAGDVIVSYSTNPSMVPAMRRAAAIVTEMGGISSHAAIVSREFNIPCIVGAKGVTKLFSNGDMVEVKAAQGVIRRLQAAP